MAAAGVMVFAGKTVAAAVIKEIVNKAFSYLNSYFGAESMAELKSKLDRGMPKIQAVLDIVNPDQVKDKSAALDTWFWQLRDAVEKAEDAIDEVEYFELRQRAKDRKVSDWGSSFAKVKHKAVKRVKDIKILDKTVKGFTHRETLKRLREAVEDLDKAAAGVADFLALADHLKGHTGQPEDSFLNSDRETGSMLTTTKVFGRREEKKLVVGWLTNTADEDSEIVDSSNHVSVFSIVGHGGMGKTTLAQLICKADVVTKHFEKKVIWVCVSTSFDAKAIISKILESFSWATPDAKSLEALQKILREKLSSVKFLLILDDVWEDKRSDQWENLFAPLREGKRGSKIVLTTRMQSVADLAAVTMEAPNRCITLDGLKEDENIKLFNRHAFPIANIQDCTALQKIGEKIATSVRGCPLVVKVVASHLRGNLTFQYWNNFFHQSLENFKGNEEDIMKVLKLSYYHLPTEMQACFRYCSLFPQDYVFSKDALVEMWMSSGLISQAADATQSLLDIGEQYLVQLTRKSFFDLRIIEYHGYEERYFLMHDLMHDLAKFVSVGECARIVDVSSLENVPKSIRHILVEGFRDLPVKKIKECTRLENLRTIVLKDKRKNIIKDNLNAMEELVVRSKSLRLFESELCHTSDFPNKLAKLHHLRFVKLQKISPENICGIVKLYHLRNLAFGAVRIEPKKLRDIGNLDHLRYLACGAVKIEPKKLRDIGNLDRLRYVPYGSNGWCKFPVSRLNYLRVLQDYHVQAVQGYKICALKDLRNLRRLGVKGLENVDKQEAIEAELKGKQYLESLSLEWSERDGAHSMTDELILENLEPNSNLKELYISGFNGIKMPQWMAKPSVENVTRLKLRKCQNLEHLPVLEILTLQHLVLEDLPKLIIIGQALNVAEGGRTELFFPPTLQMLVVRRCLKLKELPILPPSLVRLEVINVGLTKLPKIGQRHSENADTILPKKLSVYIQDCSSLVSLEGSLFEQKEYMDVLRDVSIINCTQLESAPFSFEEMNGLERIAITQCPKLRTPKEKLLPSSVRQLTIEQCGDLEFRLLPLLQCPTNISWLSLEHCTCLVSLPPADVFSKNLKYLRVLKIVRCDNLSSLGGLGSTPSLETLFIWDCCKLVEAAQSSLTGFASCGEEEHPVVLQVERLLISHTSLLFVEPLKSLRHTRQLRIGDASETESLPERWLLQNSASLRYLMLSRFNAESLPPRMRNMSSLETISLDDAGKLQSLPDLPLSLQGLYIRNCHPDLEKKIRSYGSPEKVKISHLRRVEIGKLRFILGKECSEETYRELRLEDFDTLSSWANQQKDVCSVEPTLHWWNSQCCPVKEMLPWSRRS